MPDLDDICQAGLRAAFNHRQQAFDRQLLDGAWQRTTEDELTTGSLICLIGLDRAGAVLEGLQSRTALRLLVERIHRRRQHGAIGLAVWASAIVDGPPPDQLAEAAGVRLNESLLERLTTMELAWIVSGLAHQHVRRPDSMRHLLGDAGRRLAWRQSESGLMHHVGRAPRIVGRLRGGVANFADQVYALQALSLLGLRKAAETTAAAGRLAARLVHHQGPLGQWWWHYRAERDTVLSRYPVYSVHQHGMAPMAFAALAQLTGDALDRRPADRGRRWLLQNELGLTMVDESVPTIWRSIERDEAHAARGARRLGHVLLGATDKDASVSLRLNRETRPYEWAWQLHASAIERRVEPRAHIV
jgi:hypothetical protein